MTHPDTDASTLGELRASGHVHKHRARGAPRQPARRLARRARTRGPGMHGFDDTVHPAARARPARRPRRRAARRARPGQDPAAAHAGRPARRVDAGHRRLRARRAPLRPDHASRRAPAPPSSATTCRSRGATATSGTPRSSPRPTRRVADLDRRRRPDEGGRGPHARRPRDHPLRADPAQPPRHRRDQRAARPRRAHPGRDAQRDGGARHPDPRLRRCGCRSTCCVVASANPEDYTNRGRIITPLKDRFGAEIRTHYPIELERRGRGHPRRRRTSSADVPDAPARDPGPLHPRRCASRSAVDQRSGVSARGSRSPAPRPSPRPRCTAPPRQGEDEAVARVVDLETAVDVLGGKIEFETGEEGREREVLTHLLRTRHRRDLPARAFGPRPRPASRTSSPRAPSSRPASRCRRATCWPGWARCRACPRSRPARPRRRRRRRGQSRAAVEFALEGLYLARRIDKDSVAGRTVYGA